MRYAVQLPTERADLPELLSMEGIAGMARAAEEAGFDGCFVTDHPVPGDRWLARGGHHTLDPFVALTCAASSTTRLRLQTQILVLPYRNPFLTAKAGATLDLVSGGRFTLGVSPGYLESEFAALGVDFAERNELTDEAIEVLKRTWTGEGVAFEGRHFRAEGNTQLPQPLQKPHPPIWVGGNSRRAIRRAVEHGDGWIPFPAPARMARHVRTPGIETLEDLAKRIDYAKEHAAATGRTSPLDIGFVPFGFTLFDSRPGEPGALVEMAGRLGEMGVTWLNVTLPCASRGAFCDAVADFGRRVLAA